MTTPIGLARGAGHARSARPWQALLLAATLLWLGQALAQDHQPAQGSRIDPPQELRFRDFFRFPVGPRGLELTDTLLQADGRVVRLVGYVVQQEVPTPGRFMLTPRPVQMSEHADGDADDLPPATVMVHLDPAQHDWVVPHVNGLVAVSGVLGVGRGEELDGRISWIRLQLQTDATRTMNPFELAVLLHNQQHRH